MVGSGAAIVGSGTAIVGSGTTNTVVAVGSGVSSTLTNLGIEQAVTTSIITKKTTAILFIFFSVLLFCLVLSEEICG